MSGDYNCRIVEYGPAYQILGAQKGGEAPVDPASRSFIGACWWKVGEGPVDPASIINAALGGYSGPVITYNARSTEYKCVGIVFADSDDIPDDRVNDYFEMMIWEDHEDTAFLHEVVSQKEAHQDER